MLYLLETKNKVRYDERELMTHVFLDMDGVMVDFVKGACELHEIENPYNDPKNHGKFDIVPLTGLTNEQFWALDRVFWEELEFMPDAMIILNEICKYVKEDDITLLTSPIRNPGCAEGKLNWIYKNMPRWGRRFLIGPCKHAIAGPGKLLIDDYDVNIDLWVAHGGSAIQVPRLWNRCHELDTFDFLSKELRYYFPKRYTIA